MKGRLKVLLISAYLIYRRRKFDRLIGMITRLRKPDYTRPGDELMKRHKKLWGPVSKHLSTKWLMHFCCSSGRHDERFVSPDLYYVHLEPALNNYKMLKAYADKNFYDTLYPEIVKPVVFVRCIDGCFFDRNYKHIAGNVVNGDPIVKRLFDADSVDLIVKPAIDSGQGKGVALLSLKQGKLYRAGQPLRDMATLCLLYGENFVIQEFVVQHPLTARFNPSSLNSIRVYTYRSILNEEVIPLHFMQRIGSTGKLTDGSFSIGIDRMGNYGLRYYDNAGRSYVSLNGIEVTSLKKFPFIDALSKVACMVAAKNIHSRVLGIDLIVDRHGRVMLMEVNNQSIGINKVQLTGGPLFKEYTEEIISFCKNRKRSFAFYVDH